MDTLESLAHRGYTEGFLRRHTHDEYQNYEYGYSISERQQFVGEFTGKRNEQGMAHVAIGFAKQNLRKKIYACTSSVGPGAANMITAAATATANRIPLLLLPGDVFATRQPDPVLQQIEQFHDLSISTNDAFKAVSKYWDRVSRPEQLMTACINAMRVLTDPADTGAVTLALPQDVQAEAYDFPEYFSTKNGFTELKEHYQLSQC